MYNKFKLGNNELYVLEFKKSKSCSGILLKPSTIFGKNKYSITYDPILAYSAHGRIYEYFTGIDLRFVEKKSNDGYNMDGTDISYTGIEYYDYVGRSDIKKVSYEQFQEKLYRYLPYKEILMEEFKEYMDCLYEDHNEKISIERERILQESLDSIRDKENKERMIRELLNRK